MHNITKKALAIGLLTLISAGCGLFGSSNEEFGNMKLKMPNSIVVCRAKQCAPTKVSMSSEYIYNSLTHLLTNNNRQKALICEAGEGNHACTESFVSVPIKVGITPAYMYIDAVKITDVSLIKGTPQISLVLNYNVTYNGQIPECTSSKSLLYVKNADNIIMEDTGYTCKMTAIGTTSIKTLFTIDYIDLDYGYIGGYYSIGLSGPAKGGGTGYMLIRLPRESMPLNSKLSAKGAAKAATGTGTQRESTASILDISDPSSNADGVQMFPLKR